MAHARPVTVALPLALALLLLVGAWSTPVSAEPQWPPELTDTVYAEGLTLPTDFAFLPDGTVFILEQAGLIKAWSHGELRTVLDLTDKVSVSFEQGLLGIALDPAFPARPYFFVHYTAKEEPGHIHLSRFTVTHLDDRDPVGVDPDSEVIYLGNIRDHHPAHNGATVRFGPDGMLYMGFGDDFDSCRAQDLTLLTGKIIRVYVGEGADPSNRSTLVPPDNPFASNPNVDARLVFAYGLRNPFRFDIDPESGAVVIGDVGENLWEEVSVARGGENFGWPYREGAHPYFNGTCPGQTRDPSEWVEPVYEYPHPWAASITMSTVYHDVDYPNDSSLPPEYNGVAFFGDYFSSDLRGLKLDAGTGEWRLVPGVDATNFSRGVDWFVSSHVGPDGAFYYLVHKDGLLRRAAYQAPHLLAGTTDLRSTVDEPLGIDLLDPGAPGGLSVQLISGRLPEGVTMGPGGRLSGTPTEEGEYTFAIRAADPGRPLTSDMRYYTLRVGCSFLSCLTGPTAPAVAGGALLLVAPAALFVAFVRWQGPDGRQGSGPSAQEPPAEGGASGRDERKRG